ncbi:MAG: hypothetical protein M5U26_17375 [Planctomycetota bacterium]|nr:hypothetical protein [Planctomycetota bacterium]
MRTFDRVPLRLAVLALVLIGLSGCEDQEARSSATSASKKAGELESRIAKLEGDLKSMQESVDGVRGRLENRINEDISKVQEQIRGAEEKLAKSLDQNRDDLQKNLRDQLESVRRDFDGRLDNKIKVDVAESFQAVRKDIEKTREDLIGFMDKQLKELYPYAYQPRRMDPNAAPEKPQP